METGREAALFSLYDRTGAIELARALVARGMPIYRDRRHARAPARSAASTRATSAS